MSIRSIHCRVVLDEAHIIRNKSRYAPKACNALQAQRRWCLTGMLAMTWMISFIMHLLGQLSLPQTLCRLAKSCPLNDLKDTIVRSFINRALGPLCM